MVGEWFGDNSISLTDNQKCLLTVLAKAFSNREDVRDELHDLLCELGLEYVAYSHFNRKSLACCDPGPGCSVIDTILEKRWDFLWYN